MPSFIVKLESYYMEWSTVVDAPTTFGMKLDEFEQYYEHENGRRGMEDLPNRLERVERHGTSSIGPMSASDLLELNRAGPDESELSYDEIYRAYCLRETIRDGWRPR